MTNITGKKFMAAMHLWVLEYCNELLGKVANGNTEAPDPKKIKQLERRAEQCLATAGVIENDRAEGKSSISLDSMAVDLMTEAKLIENTLIILKKYKGENDD